MNSIVDVGTVAGAVLAIAGVLGGAFWLMRKVMRIADVIEELTPNGGKSIKDQIGRIDRRLESVERRFDEHLDGGDQQ